MPAAFRAAAEELLEEEVTLEGLRAVTHAELGACPIPAGAEKLLLGVLIEDQEPEAV